MVRSADGRRRRGTWLWVAAWLGALTAAGEGLLRVGAHLLTGTPYHYTLHIWLMTPVADIAMFLVLGLGLLAVGRMVTPLAAPGVRLAVLLLPAWLTAALYVPRIALWAKVLLAAGLAVQSTRLLLPWLDGFHRAVRYSLPALLLGHAVAGGSVELRQVLAEREAARGLPPAAPGTPNVLLLIWDTVRASSLSLYGNPRSTTPGLERLAATGVTFDRAMSTAPYTLPSHASMFTGRWASQLSTDWRTPLDGTTPTLAEVLSRAGYRTAGFAANEIYVTESFGLARGFGHFREERRWATATVGSSRLLRLIATAGITRRVFGFEGVLGRADADADRLALLGWLGRQSPDRPFFAFVNFMDAHGPYLPRAPYDTLFGWYDASTPTAERRAIRLRAHREVTDIPAAEARHRLAAYEGAIAQLDAATSRLFRELADRGYLRNTLVILAADHGEEFGEHGQFDHGNSLFLQSLHVPLVISFPGHVPAAVRVPGTVSLRDIAATVLDLVGLPPALPGRSLRRFWMTVAGTDTTHVAFAHVGRLPGASPDLPVGRGDLSSAITDSLQVIREAGGADSVYDLAADPDGGTPSTAPPPLVQRLLKELPATPARAARTPPVP